MSQTVAQVEVNEAWLADALAAIRAPGDQMAKSACMQLATPLLNDLCHRLLAAALTDGKTDEVVDWLAGETVDAPARSSVYRFRGRLLEEYYAARSNDVRRRVVSAVHEIAEGDPEAMQMAVNLRLAERLSDEIEKAGDPKALMAVAYGVRTVCQTSFDKRKTDKSLQLADARAKKLEVEITLQQQKIDQLERDRAQAAAVLQQAEVSGDSAGAVVAAIKAALGIGTKA